MQPGALPRETEWGWKQGHRCRALSETWNGSVLDWRWLEHGRGWGLLCAMIGRGALAWSWVWLLCASLGPWHCNGGGLIKPQPAGNGRQRCPGKVAPTVMFRRIPARPAIPPSTQVGI